MAPPLGSDGELGSLPCVAVLRVVPLRKRWGEGALVVGRGSRSPSWPAFTFCSSGCVRDVAPGLIYKRAGRAGRRLLVLCDRAEELGMFQSSGERSSDR